MKPHHLPDGRFRNHADLENHSSFFKFLKWQWQAPDVKEITFPLAENSPEYLKTNRSDSTLTWIGHSTFLIQHQGLNILTDPHLSKRASPFKFVGPKRFTQPGLNFDQLPDIDVIVISHDHYDHLDETSVVKINKQQTQKPLFIVPLRIGKWLNKHGIKNWIELDWWETTEVQGWHFTATPVQHFSGRSLTNHNETLWAGWMMEAPIAESSENTDKASASTAAVARQKIFFAGDTGYSKDFDDIGQRFGEVDLSLIPIGAYEPRWFMKDMHVNPEEAVKIHQDVSSKFSIGIHWGTFILTDEPMDQPPKALTAALEKAEVPAEDFQVMQHGQTLDIRKYLTE